MAEAARESGAELATVAMRRVDPSARGSIVEVLEEAGLEVLPEHRRLLHGARGGHHREARARGARHGLGEARGDRRRPHAASRPGRAAGGRRGARGRRLHRPPLHERRPDPRPPPRGRRLRRGHAARVADRQRHGHQQPLQPAADHRAGARAGDPRRGRGHRLGRRAGDGGGLRRRAAGQRDLAGRGPGGDGARDAEGDRGRLRGPGGGEDPTPAVRAGVLAGGGPELALAELEREHAPSRP